MPCHYHPNEDLLESILCVSFLLFADHANRFSCWDAYYISYLQVAHDQSISASGYILNSFALTSAFISPFIGL